MPIFEAYSRYYDLLYRDKDYEAESRFVLERLKAHDPAPRRVLDLGCGTGAHCRSLAAHVPEVHGLDRSEGMIARAGAQSPSGAQWPRYHLGDVRDARLGFSVDAVVSLFHVAGYQTRNDDLSGLLATARAHLRPGGLFLFDYWHGPAVLSDPPRVRVKRMGDGATSVVRISEPELRHRECVVDVRYTVLVRDEASGLTEEFRESHAVRYLFEPEIALLARTCGFELVETAPWMDAGRPVELGDFSVYTLLRRRA